MRPRQHLGVKIPIRGCRHSLGIGLPSDLDALLIEQLNGLLRERVIQREQDKRRGREDGIGRACAGTLGGRGGRGCGWEGRGGKEKDRAQVRGEGGWWKMARDRYLLRALMVGTLEAGMSAPLVAAAKGSSKAGVGLVAMAVIVAVSDMEWDKGKGGCGGEEEKCNVADGYFQSGKE